MHKVLYLLFISLMHGINPFKETGKQRDKYRERLSDTEKEWILRNCNERAADYWRGVFYEN